MKLVSLLFLACSSLFFLASADFGSEHGPQIMKIAHEVLMELGYDGDLTDRDDIWMFFFENGLLKTFGIKVIDRLSAELPPVRALLTEEIKRRGYTGPLDTTEDIVNGIIATGLHNDFLG